MTGSTGTPWKERARRLKREIYALTLASKDPRVPWYARLFIICLLGYAFCPLDLIPDFIPVFGYLDDLIVLPLGILLAIKLIPPSVLEESRTRAQEIIHQGKPTSWISVLVIVLIWLLCAGLVALVFFRLYHS